jgi:hypothetical protein
MSILKYIAAACALAVLIAPAAAQADRSSRAHSGPPQENAVTTWSPDLAERDHGTDPTGDDAETPGQLGGSARPRPRRDL